MGHTEDYTGMELELQIQEAGIHYPRSYDVAYRAGWVMQAVGAAVLAGAVWAGGGTLLSGVPVEIPGLMLFEGGVLLSALFLLVWKAAVKRFILWAVAVGLTLQISSVFLSSHGEGIFLAGLAFVIAGANGLLGKEFYCFRFPEGLVLFLIFPPVILGRIFSVLPAEFFPYFYAVTATLLISFTIRKLSQPLLKGCSGVCGLPEQLRG